MPGNYGRPPIAPQKAPPKLLDSQSDGHRLQTLNRTLSDVHTRLHTLEQMTADTTLSGSVSSAIAFSTSMLTGSLLGPPKVFTTNGTYNPNQRARFIIIEAQGGGGGGGSATAGAGVVSESAGGGSGVYARWVVVGTPGQWVGGTVTGPQFAGGTGGTGGGAGGTGADASITVNGTTYTAKGGTGGGGGTQGGTLGVAVGGIPQAGSTAGALCYAGEPGGHGVIVGTGGGGFGWAGNGGASPMGLASQGGGSPTATAGYGAGGGGIQAINATNTGGQGSPAIVIVYEYG